MSDMTLFQGGTSVSTLFADVESNVAANVGGSGSTNRRISIKGGVFREILNGKEVNVSEERAMNVVIINASKLSRMYFEGTYTEGVALKPTCWSSDSQTPDQSVPEAQRQARSCADCKQNIKGSGANGGRSCRFQQRLALLLDGNIDKKEVYQLTLPATSIFGDGEKGKLPLQGYVRYVAAHNTRVEAIVTEMRFDTSSPTPKLVFKPVRALTDDEAKVVVEMIKAPETLKAITLNVSQMDGVIPAPQAQAALFAPAPEAKAEAAPEPEVEEPKLKVSKKTAPPAEAPKDLADVMADWDD
jgi:hypothetical protein